jgi:hypothetical protein
MSKCPHSFEQVIDATILTIDVLTEICGARLGEQALDKLLCSAYREFLADSTPMNVPSGG